MERLLAPLVARVAILGSLLLELGLVALVLSAFGMDWAPLRTVQSIGLFGGGSLLLVFALYLFSHAVAGRLWGPEGDGSPESLDSPALAAMPERRALPARGALSRRSIS